MRPDDASSANDSHHAGFAYDIASRILVQNGGEKAGPKPFDLGAWVSQSCHFENCTVPDAKTCAAWQSEKVYAARRDVLAEFAFGNLKSPEPELIEEFGVNQVHLPEIGLRRIDRDARSVLDGLPCMSIPLDPQPFHNAIFGRDLL